MNKITIVDQYGEINLDQIVQEGNSFKRLLAETALLFSYQVAYSNAPISVYTLSADSLTVEFLNMLATHSDDINYVMHYYDDHDVCNIKAASDELTLVFTHASVRGTTQLDSLEELMAELCSYFTDKKKDLTRKLACGLLLYGIQRVFAYDPIILRNHLTNRHIRYEDLSVISYEDMARLFKQLKVRYANVELTMPYGTSMYGSLQMLLGELREFM